MSDRPEEDVRGEQRRVARQQLQLWHRQGENSTTTVETVGECRSLPSPEAMMGESWNNWVHAAKLHRNDGAELDDTFKEFTKHREAMRLCREDMPIFGLCPSHDDFYLVICNHCNQVIKPQAFQSHYERRHSSSSKHPLTPPSSVYSLFSSLSSKSKGGGGGCSGTRTSSGSSSVSSHSKLLKSPKEKLQIGGNSRPMHFVQHNKIPHGKIMIPSVKVEKMHSNPKIDGVLLKTAPTCSSTVSSSIKTGLNCPSIPKPPLPSPGQIPNGKGLLSTPPVLEKKPDDTANHKKFLYKRLAEREFDPDIHCGVVDVETKKPCTRSLTCKTHSLGYRRAVLGRRKRFDVLLAEHKSKTREKELLRNSEHQQQMPPLREPHPSPSKTSQELHQTSHGITSAELKPSVPNKPRPHNASLPRPAGYPAQHSGNALSDAPSINESPHPVVPAAEPASRLSSDEGEGEDKEEPADKLDCHYSGHHPRPAAFCAFGSRQIGRGGYVFDKRWDHIRCALNFMVDKHLNSQMWKKIPPASANSASVQAAHRASTNSTPVLQYNVGATGFLSPSTFMSSPPLVSPSCTSLDSKVLSYGTTLNAHPAALGAMDPLCSMQSRQVSPSPATPSVLSSVPSPMSSKPQKPKSSKSLKPKESSASNVNCSSTSSNVSSGGSEKKRKNSSLLLSQSSAHSTESVRRSPSSPRNFSYHSSMTSLSHSGLHSGGPNCMINKANSVSFKHDQSGRGPPTGSPAESIKRMSVVMNSSDSTLSLGPFIHQSSEQTVNSHSSFSHSHAALDKFIGKKRKCSPGSSSLNNNSSSSRSSKIAKVPSVNNHTRHTSAVPGTQGLTNSSLLHQPKARP